MGESVHDFEDIVSHHLEHIVMFLVIRGSIQNRVDYVLSSYSHHRPTPGLHPFSHFTSRDGIFLNSRD